MIEWVELGPVTLLGVESDLELLRVRRVEDGLGCDPTEGGILKIFEPYERNWCDLSLQIRVVSHPVLRSLLFTC